MAAPAVLEYKIVGTRHVPSPVRHFEILVSHPTTTTTVHTNERWHSYRRQETRLCHSLSSFARPCHHPLPTLASSRHSLHSSTLVKLFINLDLLHHHLPQLCEPCILVSLQDTKVSKPWRAPTGPKGQHTHVWFTVHRARHVEGRAQPFPSVTFTSPEKWGHRLATSGSLVSTNLVVEVTGSYLAGHYLPGSLTLDFAESFHS